MIDLTQKAVHVVTQLLADRKGYGLRLKKADDCCGIKFDLVFDKKTKTDKIIKKHGQIHVFSDRDTLGMINFLARKKIFVKTTVDYISTPLTKGFISNNHRLNLNIWEHELV